jgi:hypothetical protein
MAPSFSGVKQTSGDPGGFEFTNLAEEFSMVLRKSAWYLRDEGVQRFSSSFQEKAIHAELSIPVFFTADLRIVLNPVDGLWLS